ncbi:MAG: DNA polymerase [Phycisphaerae bacterium]
MKPADPNDPPDAIETNEDERDQENHGNNVDPSKLPRGASEGPLSKLTPVFVDCETYVSETVNLDTMTLRQYLSASYLTAIAVAVGPTDPVQVFYTAKNPGPPGAAMVTDELRQVLVYLASDPNYVFVAHNASFDARVLRFHLGVPHPVNVWCSMEGAMGAWPELPGGFSLSNLAKRLRLPEDRRKLELDLHRLQKLQDKCPLAAAKADELIVSQMKSILKVGGIPWPEDDVITRDLCAFVLAIYNQRDVEAMRDVFLLQAARLPAVEQGVALRTHHQRRHHFMVDSVRLDEFVTKMDENAAYAEKEVEAMVGTGDLRAVFNRDNDNGILTSIRYKRLKNLVNDKLATEQFESTSLKKISPLQLARNPKVYELLTQTTRAGKMMSHKRRAKVFAGVDEVDTELGYARAHTGRFSSPSTGKGLNLHNVPKHDKAVAEPVRKLFRVPPGFCLVRGDLANVEFRIEGYLTGAVNVFKMFDSLKGGNIFTDPYSSTWQNMTGVKITKKDPVRQVAKSATLGLGFCMSPPGYAKVLLMVLADKKSGVSEQILHDIIIKNSWHMPRGDRVQRIMLMLGCSQTVAIAAYYIHKLFNEAYPEFRMTAYWLVKVIEEVAASGSNRDQARFRIDEMYKTTDAPDRNLINLEIDDDPLTLYPSVRACCGPWPRTVCWREPHMRKTDFAGADAQKKLTIRKATGEFKVFTPQLAIENVTQAAARNALCMGVERLDHLGFRDIIHVHDEIMILCRREREHVLAARDALIDTFGPKHTMPYAWSILVKPDEVTLTESLYEDELDILPRDKTYKNKEGQEVPGPDRWGRIERNEPGCLLALP